MPTPWGTLLLRAHQKLTGHHRFQAERSALRPRVRNRLSGAGHEDRAI